MASSRLSVDASKKKLVRLGGGGASIKWKPTAGKYDTITLHRHIWES